MKYIVLLLLSAFSCLANGAHVDCGYSEVGLLYVIGSRTDGGANKDRLRVTIPSSCGVNKGFGFVNNDEAFYQGIFSMLLAAKMSKTPIRFVVDDQVTTSNSVRIVWVNFE